MKKYKIGNDIRLAVTLRQFLNDHNLKERNIYNPADHNFETIDANPFVNKQYELYYDEHYSDSNGDPIEFQPNGKPVSIISVKAVLINETRKKELEQLRTEYFDRMQQIEKNRFDALRKHSRFIARFPIEPAMECFNATPYDVCGCGYPTYRAYPKAYLFAPYHGFGVNPHWEGIYKPLFPAPAFPPEKPISRKLKDSVKDDSKYIAEVAATNHPNIVEVLFPAVHQLHTGVYSMLITAKLYCPGFNASNTKTVTLHVPNVFELVGSDEYGSASDIVVNVNNIRDILYDQYNEDPDDIYTEAGSISGYDLGTLTLNRNDGVGVDIDLDPLTTIYEAD